MVPTKNKEVYCRGVSQPEQPYRRNVGLWSIAQTKKGVRLKAQARTNFSLYLFSLFTHTRNHSQTLHGTVMACYSYAGASCLECSAGMVPFSAFDLLFPTAVEETWSSPLEEPFSNPELDAMLDALVYSASETEQRAEVGDILSIRAVSLTQEGPATAVDATTFDIPALGSGFKYIKPRRKKENMNGGPSRRRFFATPRKPCDGAFPKVRYFPEDSRSTNDGWVSWLLKLLLMGQTALTSFEEHNKPRLLFTANSSKTRGKRLATTSSTPTGRDCNDFV
ncbi:hypothetical protein QOT17_016373 [Balamuthia mandrillaris]